MKRVFQLLFLLIALAVTGAVALWLMFLSAPAGYAERLAFARDQAQRGVDRGRWAGVMWAVVAPGEVLATGAAGYADRALNRPMTPDTVMPVGSVSKLLIGLAGAQAIADGALDPDAPITDILSIPFDPPDGQPRSFAQLATHRAGLIDTAAVYAQAGYGHGGVTHPMPLAQYLGAALGADGAFYTSESFAAMGRYRYSNLGAGLAAQVIADATGQDFAAMTQAQIVAPLGMQGHWGHVSPPGPQNAILYDRAGEAFMPLAPYGLATWPGGQFNASARDLARLMAAMMDRGRLAGAQVLPAQTVDLVTRPWVDDLPGMTANGDFIGLFWTRETLNIGPVSLQLEGHSGEDQGLTVFVYRQPDAPTGFVLMFNSRPRDQRDVFAMMRLVRTLAGMPLPPP